MWMNSNDYNTKKRAIETLADNMGLISDAEEHAKALGIELDQEKKDLSRLYASAAEDLPNMVSPTAQRIALRTQTDIDKESEKNSMQRKNLEQLRADLF